MDNTAAAAVRVPPLSPDAAQRLLRGESRTPHDILGAHPAVFDGVQGVTIRARHTRAQSLAVVVNGGRHVMEREHDELFSIFLPRAPLPLPYRLFVERADGTSEEYDDPYRFMPTLGDMDLPSEVLEMDPPAAAFGFLY